MKNTTPQNATFNHDNTLLESAHLSWSLNSLVPALKSNLNLQKKLKFFPVNRFIKQEKLKKGTKELHLSKKTIIPTVSEQDESFEIIYELANVQFCLESQLIIIMSHILLRANFYLSSPSRKLFVLDVHKLAKSMVKGNINLALEEEWVYQHIKLYKETEVINNE